MAAYEAAPFSGGLARISFVHIIRPRGVSEGIRVNAYLDKKGEVKLWFVS
jgi:hypothetical protein